MRKLKLILASIFVAGFAVVGINNIVSKQNQLQFETMKLNSTSSQIKGLNLQYDLLNKEFDNLNLNKELNQDSINKLNEKKQELETKKAKLEAELQAQAKAKEDEAKALALASEKIINTVTNTQVAMATNYSNYELVIAAGISPSDFTYVDFIVMHEGHYDPCVINGGAVDCNYAVNGGGRAYGVCQALPGTKMASAGADWATNPITQLKWCNSYAIQRYGSWAGAYNFWIANKWW